MHPVGNRVHHDLLEGRGHGHGAGVMREREENPSSLRDLCRAASVEKVWGLRKRLGFADFRKGGRAAYLCKPAFSNETLLVKPLSCLLQFLVAEDNTIMLSGGGAALKEALIRVCQ
jgi:hypothetical protein